MKVKVSSTSGRKSVSFKLSFLPDNFAAMGFVPDLERKIGEWKGNATKGYFSQKRRGFKAALQEFIDLNQVDEYFVRDYDKRVSPNYWSDSVEIWYTKKA